MSGSPRGTFPKSAHLLKRADFQRVYQQGKRHFSGNMTVFYLSPTPPDPAPVPRTPGPRSAKPATALPAGIRIGFTVPKAIGNAVDRNRIRRRVREAVRRQIATLGELKAPLDIVINPKRGALAGDFGELAAEVARAFQVVAQRGGMPARPLAGTRRGSR